MERDKCTRMYFTRYDTSVEYDGLYIHTTYSAREKDNTIHSHNMIYTI